ncbi:PepSY domain-containing protein [Ornithinibacillus massiliensis]|uniref:PepSY domain-containing protein n=1 Tax=Ornithinibacillus massiliensis TaxID=1944633 RepID=A0ABS5MAL3_9BACI|nr:PepSY domain-containing protein [Ornithinibacillus massiliensis]MBS3679341.1 PepSY domain-containing protein [Ornithinibacillus massiliensis]
MNKKLVTGVLIIGLLLSGTTIAAANLNDNATTTKKDDTVKTEVVKEKEGIISLEEAIEIALAEHDGYVESIELERKRGKVYYEVDFENPDVDVYIDASTGEVLRVDWDDDDDRYDENHKPNMENIISIEEAKEIAVAEVGGKVIEIDLDKDDGRYEYELELRTDRGEAEITIDAESGEIVELELD